MLKEELIRKAAFDLAKSEGWRWVTLSKIADVTGFDPHKVKNLYKSKTEILISFIDYINSTTISNFECRKEDTIRDRLFDLLMTRFDTLFPYKDGLASIIRDSTSDPLACRFLLTRMSDSMNLLLEAAEVPTQGCIGKLKVKGLFLVYANTFRVWLTDDSPDMAKTMSTLDGGLRQAELLASSLWITTQNQSNSNVFNTQPLKD